MIENETAEKATLSELAKIHPETVFKAKRLCKTFWLKDGRQLYYWGSRYDLDTSIGIREASGFGLKPQDYMKGEIAQAKKTQFPLINDCFFFLFSGKNGQTKVELLELVSKPGANRLVFRPTGYKTSF